MYKYRLSFDYGYPAHITMAFEGVVYYRPGKEDSIRLEDEYTPKEAIEAFVRRWGGLDLDTFERVLHVGKGVDRIAAILAIGYLAAPQTPDMLLPLLSGPVLAERVASAYVLGLMRDERALPGLLHMLLLEYHTQDKSEANATSDLFGPWYAGGLESIAYLLGEWGPPSVIPVLRQVFLEIETRVREGQSNQFEGQYQDAVIYALGQRGAFGILSGLDLPRSRLRYTMFWLALGSLEAGTRYEDFQGAMRYNEDLHREILGVLEQRFGLSSEEQQEILQQRASDSLERYEHFYQEVDDEDEASE